jgi:hypothetical protein
MRIKLLSGNSFNFLQKKSRPHLACMRFKAGGKVPLSGIYQELANNKLIITNLSCIKGERFPAYEHLSFFTAYK